MNLPPHGRRTCLGFDLNGQRESCAEPVEEGSPFPFCAYHRNKILATPVRRTCAGAVVYDAAMRRSQVECNNLTGHEDEPLCASCRVLEVRNKDFARNALADRCPTCGQCLPPTPRPQHTNGHASYPTNGTYRSPSSARSYVPPTSRPGHGVRLFQPRKRDDE